MGVFSRFATQILFQDMRIRRLGGKGEGSGLLWVDEGPVALHGWANLWMHGKQHLEARHRTDLPLSQGERISRALITGAGSLSCSLEYDPVVAPLPILPRAMVESG